MILLAESAPLSLLPLSSTAQAFLCTFFTIPFLIRLAKSRKYLDNPNARKIHKAPIPTLGGVGIFTGILFSGLFWLLPTLTLDIEYPSVFSGIFILFLLGLQDDIKDLSARRKFLIQVLVALLTAWGGIRFTSFHGFLGIEELSLFWQYSLTVLLITGIINAFNLLDGLDGLAGGISLINSLAFAVLFMWGGQEFYATLSLILAGSLAAFLLFNFNPARIFMGDSGSLMIGYLMIVLGLKAIDPTIAGDTGIDQAYLMAIVFAALLLPVADTLRVFGFRILKKTSPFTPDQNHIHHILLKLRLKVRNAALVIYLIHFSTILLALALTEVVLEYAIITLVVYISFIFIGLITLSRLRNKNSQRRETPAVTIPLEEEILEEN